MMCLLILIPGPLRINLDVMGVIPQSPAIGVGRGSPPLNPHGKHLMLHQQYQYHHRTLFMHPIGPPQKELVVDTSVTRGTIHPPLFASMVLSQNISPRHEHEIPREGENNFSKLLGGGGTNNKNNLLLIRTWAMVRVQWFLVHFIQILR